MTQRVTRGKVREREREPWGGGRETQSGSTMLTCHGDEIKLRDWMRSHGRLRCVATTDLIRKLPTFFIGELRRLDWREVSSILALLDVISTNNIIIYKIIFLRIIILLMRNSQIVLISLQVNFSAFKAVNHLIVAQMFYMLLSLAPLALV